jgi:hypothetical protein
MISNMQFVRNIFLPLCLLIVLLTPVTSSASEITVRPFLIDQTLVPRDVYTETVTIKSDYTNRKAIIYATVNEITIDSEGEIKEFVSPVMTDRTSTITSWIEVSRGRIAILPGERAEVPLTIRVHPYAKPGEYHAFIGFVEAANRPKAEEIAMNGEAKGVLVKVIISDQRKDNLKISSFTIDRFVTGENSRSIDIAVENTGDIATAPKGEIIFYDSRGVEVSSLPVNTEGVIVEPGENIDLHAEVPVEGKLGRFKANLSLQYGENQRANLYDTSYFYLLPTHLLMLVFGGILIIAILVALLFRRVFIRHDDDDDFQEVTMYVREGHDPDPKDHDINLKQNS